MISGVIILAWICSVIIGGDSVYSVIPMDDYTVFVYFEDGKIVCYDMSGVAPCVGGRLKC